MEIVLPEIVAIGIYNSQFAVKNKSITKNRKTTMFEIEIPIEKGGISYINSEQKHIEPNMIICAKPGQTRHSKLPYKCYYIHMIVKDCSLKTALEGIPDYLETEKYEYYFNLFKKMCEYNDTTLETDEIIVQSILLEIIYSLIKEAGEIKSNGKINSSNGVIEKVIKYIKDNLTSDLSLNSVAKEAGFSTIHFHNFFKVSTGKTLHDYVEEQRIKKAANMLVTTDYTLTKIAYECGFSSQSYFSYAFKRRMNVTPREYAKKVFNKYGN